MIKAIIIDDEPRSLKVILDMIINYFPDITIVATCRNLEEGKAAIQSNSPNLVFLDIELEKRTGFELLQELDKIDFEVIFTTAHEKYALKAIKFCALDFLLKPCSLEELTLAINRYRNKQTKDQTPGQFDVLFHNLKNIQKESKKIALSTTNGLVIIPVKEIIRCEADNNYTVFRLSNNNRLIVSRTLKEFEELLVDYDFIRVHSSHLINLNYVQHYTRGDGGFVNMSDGSEVGVSRKKKDEFLKRLAEL